MQKELSKVVLIQAICPLGNFRLRHFARFLDGVFLAISSRFFLLQGMGKEIDMSSSILISLEPHRPGPRK
jgi:hypothetical protein